MEALKISAAPQHTQALVLRTVAGIAVALLVAFLFGSLLSGDWTLPMDPAIGAAFTA